MDQATRAASVKPPAFPYSDEFKNHIRSMLHDREGTADYDAWFHMAQARVDFQRRNFLPSLHRFVDCRDQRVLEIGCGTGPTTVVLAVQGARVVATDIDPRMTEATRLRVRDHGLSDRVESLTVDRSDRLPFADATFDLVVVNGVLEHVPPAERAGILRDLWRVVRPGGHLFVGETPNRLWPVDSHTTGLWWLHYLPARWAARYARRRHRIQPEDDLLPRGGLGCTYRRLVRAVPAAERCELNRQPDHSWLHYH
jgi:ubiquinone/menaquinone biosynthesis C-methylase UbiE